MGAAREAVRAAPADRRAGVTAAFWVASYLGGGLPVVLVGVAATSIGVPAAVRVAAVLIGLACLLVLAVALRHRGRADLGAPSDRGGSGTRPPGPPLNGQRPA